MSEEKREPLLSDYDSILADEDTDSDGWRSHYEKSAMDKLQAFYENLIDTGVLMVVKVVSLVNVADDRGIGCFICPSCNERFPMQFGFKRSDNFCNGCGAKII